MKLTLKPNNARTTAALEQLIENRLLALSDHQLIEEAVVKISDEPEASPRFQASILIHIAGPDIHAATCDHTLLVAVEKALASVENQVFARQAQRRTRRRSQLQQPATPRTGRAW